MVDILCVAVTFCRSHLRIQNNTEGIKVVNCQQPPGLIKKQLVVDNLEKLWSEEDNLLDPQALLLSCLWESEPHAGAGNPDGEDDRLPSSSA